ncbi:hypothetical protein [Blastococcus tunisiensis]|uniref:Uncharacterized protein n=1 Tax=Blastococcus tunisiensis TaxID=1798228 RepID=A0A1I1WUA8_9ACTN|nr:hypothetical protein [Blastococcus sp. DSM 46838]SFD96680.1 hypothetical protein SAMN05216574_101466 [Blastococcus sp. DSM 46838]
MQVDTDAPGAEVAGPPAVDMAAVRQAMEYCAEQGWTDGLPVVPVTDSFLQEFLQHTDRAPDDVVFRMPHLNRTCSVRAAAINAAMAGCLPEYFPVVLAAWDALTQEGYAGKGIWQSTTGTAPLLLVNGPVRERLGINSRGNVFGSGFRANATIGRAIRLTAINAFGLHPQQLDQATQGTPAKYSACIAENEEESPWPPLHADAGLDAGDSAVTAMLIRSAIHVEARHTTDPEQLGRDIAGTLARTGALVHETISGCLVLGPEHAWLFDRAGWSKADVRQFVHEHATNTRARLVEVGKDAVSRHTRWRLPDGHPDAVPDTCASAGQDVVPVLNSPEALLVAVAGARNAGVSAVLETFGPRGGPPAVARIPDDPTQHPEETPR